MRQVPDYLAIADAAMRASEKSEVSEISPSPDTFSRFSRFSRALSELESRCPGHVDVGAWQTCISDGRRFLRTWGEQAEAFGWTSRDLFGLGPCLPTLIGTTAGSVAATSSVFAGCSAVDPSWPSRSIARSSGR